MKTIRRWWYRLTWVGLAYEGRQVFFRPRSLGKAWRMARALWERDIPYRWVWPWKP